MKRTLAIAIVAILGLVLGQKAYASTVIAGTISGDYLTAVSSPIKANGYCLVYKGSYPDMSQLQSMSSCNLPYYMPQDLSSDGNYYYCPYNGNFSSCYNNSYMPFNLNSGVITLGAYIQTYSTTQIISVSPATNAIYMPATSTTVGGYGAGQFDINFEYYNSTSSATSTIAFVSFLLSNNGLSSNGVFNFAVNTAGTGYTFLSGDHAFTFTVSNQVPFGNYELYTQMFNSDYQVLGATTSTNITFGATSTAITFQNVFGASSSNPFDIANVATSSVCSITDLTGCFKNALTWALYPNMSLIGSEISNLRGTIQNKPPFGYFKMLEDDMNNLSASGTSAFSITIPTTIKNIIFDPFKTALEALLWFFGCVWLYNRLKHIQL